jgi:hypothetical protein
MRLTLPITPMVAARISLTAAAHGDPFREALRKWPIEGAEEPGGTAV